MKPGPQLAKWAVKQPKHYPEFQDPLPLNHVGGLPEAPPVVRELAINPYSGGGTPTGREKPVQRVFRAMSHHEWGAARDRGFIQSDGRENIFGKEEGTNAALDRDTAGYYARTSPNNGTVGGVVAEIKVHPDDGWFATDPDNYLRTRKPIPIDRVVSKTVVHGEMPDPEQVAHRQRREEFWAARSAQLGYAQAYA